MVARGTRVEPAASRLGDNGGMAAQLRLLAVHAHPDDESSKGGATMVRYAREGVRVLVATCTGGERGSVLNPALNRDDITSRLAEVRREEMARAQEILGVEHEWLGFVDSGLPEGDPLPPLPRGSFAALPLAEATAPLVALVRRFRPHVMLTYDERGGYPHPDHIRTHEVSVAAFERAGDPESYPGTGEPWQPLKLYYHMTFTKDRVTALHRALVTGGLESPYQSWLDEWDDDRARPPRVTTRVDCGEFFELRDRALLSHETQVDPAGRWFSVPVDLQREVWPTEDFELARSLVDTELPEDDLFAGVREEMAA
jgi:mycothiol S-conjugate amidase